MIVNELINGVTSIQKLNEKEFNLKTTLKIIKNSEEFDRVLKVFNDKRTKILEDFEPETSSDEEKNIVADKIQALLDEDVDLDFTKLTLDELSDIKLSSEYLTPILWLIEDA